MSNVVRVFVGSSANGEDADIEIAYENSIRQNCSSDVEIVWMRQSNDPDSYWGGWNTPRWSTPFSGFRWAIPEYCNFEGRAIYTDCDMINFRDMTDLVNVELNGKPIAARRGTRFGGHEFCVMVFDCAAFRKHALPVQRMKKIAESHHRLMNVFAGNSNLVEDLDPKWNCLDGEHYALDDIYQLHFTNMGTQPWHPSWYTGVEEPHPRQDVAQAFQDAFNNAISNGYDNEALRSQLQEDVVSYNIIGK